MNLSNIANALSLPACSPIAINAVKIDSREIKPGDLYVAIVGERLDGHDFIDDALSRGAAAIVVSQPIEANVPVLLVDDTIKALGEIAALHRQQFSLPVAALTGSNGKTSVKEMIAAILPQPSYASAGNYNNHIGVPLCLFNLKPEHRYAVFELGANHRGEIAYTSSLVKPKVTLINNIAPAHIEGFGSLEGVAIAKGEIYECLPKEGIAVVNADSDFSHFWDDKLAKLKVIRFSQSQPVDVYAENIHFDKHYRASFDCVIGGQSLAIRLKVPGKHSVSNALAAASICHGLGLDNEVIEKGLNSFEGVKGRMAFKQNNLGSMIIDDTYNANLHSTLAAIEVLREMPGEKAMVFGDMGELGDSGPEHHRQVGQKARESGIDHFYCCGKLSHFAAEGFGDSSKHFDDRFLMATELKRALNANTVVLVKGSRSAKMDEVVNHLFDQ